jgi:hypothetical protein
MERGNHFAKFTRGEKVIRDKSRHIVCKSLANVDIDKQYWYWELAANHKSLMYTDTISTNGLLTINPNADMHRCKF